MTMRGCTNHDYEGELEIYPAGLSSKSQCVWFTINFDLTPEQRQTRDDPYWPAEALVNSVSIRVNGEKAECPDWLEKLILDAVDDDDLIEYATEDADAF